MIGDCDSDSRSVLDRQSWTSSSVMKRKSVPARLAFIHWSIRLFNSGLKWFFQSPVLPANVFQQQQQKRAETAR